MGVPSKQVIIDCLVLVFSKSKISGIVGTDALRTVLDIQYKDLIEGDTFSMQGVWDLLAEQPGFDEEFAKPPIARFKNHEVLLGVHVKLPESMAEMGSLELAGTAAHCRVAESELEKIIAKHDPKRQAEKSARRAEAAAAAEKSSTDDDVGTRSRMPLLIGAVVVALAGFGFVGWQLYTQLNPSPDFTAMTASGFAGIPVKSVKRQGNEAVVELSDDTWAKKQDKAALEKALVRLEGGGIEVILVKNKSGHIVASAQFFDSAKGRKIEIRFR